MASKIRGSDSFDSSKLIGKGSTAENVTSLITSGQPRTNNKGRPITVYLTIGGSNSFGVEVDNFPIYTPLGSSDSDRKNVMFIVEDGETYTITSAGIVSVVEK